MEIEHQKKMNAIDKKLNKANGKKDLEAYLAMLQALVAVRDGTPEQKLKWSMQDVDLTDETTVILVRLNQVLTTHHEEFVVNGNIEIEHMFTTVANQLLGVVAERKESSILSKN